MLFYMKKNSKNNNLTNAKREKNDEFYTQLTDIEKEVSHYKTELKWKTIFCNCDDPWYSDFFKYFVLQFEAFWLKKLITTHFEINSSSYKIEVNSKNLHQIIPYIKNTSIFDNGEIFKIFGMPLEWNWDFRSPECIEILKEADIVLTNPPFSLFREYITQLMEHKKKFLIIWNDNAITYKEVFKFIKENKLWFWYGKVKEFKKPDKTTQKFGNVGWFTNLETTKRYEDLILYKTYNPNEYPKYDNYDAINVDKVKDIPINYTGPMWVPITFLDKYNPKQFEILGMSSGNIVGEYFYGGIHIINWKMKYARIFIKNKKL